MMEPKYKKIFSIVFLSILLILFVNYSNNLIKKERARKEAVLKAEKLAVFKNALESLQLEARAVSVYDSTKGKFIYGRNENQILPIASLAKIATALVVLNDENIREVEITKEALAQFGDDTLKLGEKWQKQNLIPYALITSSNDAIYAFGSSSDFIEKINDYVHNVGLVNTSFKNSTGLDFWAEKEVGAESTAREINLLAVRAWRLYPKVFEQTAAEIGNYESISGTNYEAKNTNILLSDIKNAVFSKTGYTTLAGGNLVMIVELNNQHYVAVSVLGSTREGRFTDMRKILNVLYNNQYE